MITLATDEFILASDPAGGGAVSSLSWRGRDILHPRSSAASLDGGMFCLVPFSNRVAGSRFTFDGREIQLRPNHPILHDEPAMHGCGWLSSWRVANHTPDSAEMVLDHGGRDWPWRFRAVQRFLLAPGVASFSLAITNLDHRLMPAGLGFHPYFPCNSATRYLGLHRGEWQTGRNCLPTKLHRHSQPTDWWEGQPVATRSVDTVYEGRTGDLRVEWPDQGCGVRLVPSADLSFTTVYVPPHEAFFCVEPVSHETDALNRADGSSMRQLAPGETWTVSLRMEPYEGSLLAIPDPR